MSLRDTIDAARKEAEGNGMGLPGKRDKAESATEEDERRGFSRSSVARAKPSREAASSVRVATSPSKKALAGTETKEEKRARRRREREEEDLRNRAFDLVMRSLPGYKKTERVFWVTMGVGLALSVVSILCAYVFEGQSDLTTAQGIVSVGSLVAAYACIIGGFIYDLRKRRPYRREAEARVKGLSDKKLAEIFEKARAAQAKK